ncbi:MAG: hypothetical protein JXQ29_00610 [Planctomycetes bacterium]|nr:hypothetical protein [Planctomycetota bacterium]
MNRTLRLLASLSPQSRWQRFRLVLVGLFLFRGLALLCVFPPFEGWDEYQHVAYIVHLLEQGEPPRPGKAYVSPSLLRNMVVLPHNHGTSSQVSGERLPLRDHGLREYAEFWRATLYPRQLAPGTARELVVPLAKGGGRVRAKLRTEEGKTARLRVVRADPTTSRLLGSARLRPGAAETVRLTSDIDADAETGCFYLLFTPIAGGTVVLEDVQWGGGRLELRHLAASALGDRGLFEPGAVPRAILRPPTMLYLPPLASGQRVDLVLRAGTDGPRESVVALAYGTGELLRDIELVPGGRREIRLELDFTAQAGQDAVLHLAATGEAWIVLEDFCLDYESCSVDPRSWFPPPDVDVFLYESQHTPVYYRLVAPVFSVAGGVADLKSSIALVRLVNLALAALAIWLILGGIGHLLASKVQAGLLGLVVTLHPLLLVNAARVSSDALGVLLGTLVITWILRLDGRRMHRRAVALGALLGLAVLAKTVNLALLPLVACGWFVLWLDRRLSLPAALGSLVLFVFAAGAVTWSYFWSNLTQFGTLTLMSEAVANRAAGRGVVEMLETALQLDWAIRWRQVWFSDALWTGGWSYLLPPALLSGAYILLLGLSVLGFPAGWLAGRRGARPLVPEDRWAVLRFVVLCLGFLAAMAYHTIQFAMVHEHGMPSNPWYAAVALPWFLTLVFLGSRAWPGTRLKFALPALLVLLFLVTELYGVIRLMIPRYSASSLCLEALARLASLQPAWLGTPMLVLSAVLAFVLLAAAVAALGAAAKRAN